MRSALLVAVVLAACSGDSEPGPSELPVASVSIAPDSLTVLMLGYGGLTVVLEDSRGHALTGREVAWTSASPAVASVDANGTVRGLTLGAANIIATSNGRADTVPVAVIPKIVLSPRLPSLFPGDTTQLNAAVLTATGSPAGAVPVTWSAAGGVSVNGSGIVLGATPGIARVTAAAAGGVSWVDVTVVKRPGTLTRKVAWTTYESIGDMQHGEVWVANADGSDAVRVSPPNSNPGPASWSPNGDRLAFTLWPVFPATDGAMMMVVSPSGTLLASAPGFYGNGLAWSPDGTTILYSPDHTALWTWKIGSRPDALLWGLKLGVTGQNWSPDGRMIAFGNEDCTGATVMDADRSNQVSLAVDACAPAFSPDGKMLAYSTAPSGASGVFIVSRTSGATRPASPNCIPGPGCSGANPHQLLNWRTDGYSVSERNQVFKSFDTRSGAVTSLGTPPSEFWVEGWSPDSSKVLYSGTDGVIRRIGVMNADFSNQHYISSADRGSWFPAWQPAP